MSVPHIPPNERAVPVHVSVENGIVFIKCPDCGLVQSSESAKPKQMANGNMLLHCIRCSGLLDPDEELTPSYLASLKTLKNGLRSTGVTVPTNGASTSPATASATAAPPSPPPTPQKPVEPGAGAVPGQVTQVYCLHSVTLGTGQIGFCGKPLTFSPTLGWFASCGHSVNADGSPKVASTHAKTQVPQPLSAGESFALTWGEEVFRTGEFSTFRVGPFTRTSTVHPGETEDMAKQRVYEDLRGFAMREFDRKAEDHLDNIDRLAGKLTDRATRRRAAVA